MNCYNMRFASPTLFAIRRQDQNAHYQYVLIDMEKRKTGSWSIDATHFDFSKNGSRLCVAYPSSLLVYDVSNAALILNIPVSETSKVSCIKCIDNDQRNGKDECFHIQSCNKCSDRSRHVPSAVSEGFGYDTGSHTDVSDDTVERHSDYERDQQSRVVHDRQTEDQRLVDVEDRRDQSQSSDGSDLFRFTGCCQNSKTKCSTTSTDGHEGPPEWLIYNVRQRYSSSSGSECSHVCAVVAHQEYIQRSGDDRIMDTEPPQNHDKNS